MKTFLISLALMCFSVFSVTAQSFPGKKPELLINKTVKPIVIDKDLREFSYENFYLKLDTITKSFSMDADNKPFHKGLPIGGQSDYEKLVGKKFKVTSVEALPYNNISGQKYAIKLQSDELGTIYYNYSPEYETSFELEVVGGMDFPEGYYCDQITLNYDKFDKVSRFYTPVEAGVCFVKVKKSGKITYFISVSTYSTSLTLNKKGLAILFSDGTRFSKPAAYVSAKANSSGYTYTAFEPLTAAEMIMFSKKLITDTKLYIYTDTVDTVSAKKEREYVKCIIKK